MEYMAYIKQTSLEEQPFSNQTPTTLGPAYFRNCSVDFNQRSHNDKDHHVLFAFGARNFYLGGPKIQGVWVAAGHSSPRQKSRDLHYTRSAAGRRWVVRIPGHPALLRPWPGISFRGL